MTIICTTHKGVGGPRWRLVQTPTAKETSINAYWSLIKRHGRVVNAYGILDGVRGIFYTYMSIYNWSFVELFSWARSGDNPRIKNKWVKHMIYVYRNMRRIRLQCQIDCYFNGYLLLDLYILPNLQDVTSTSIFTNLHYV